MRQLVGVGAQYGLLLLLLACRGSAAPAPAPPAPREVEVVTMVPTELRDAGEYLGTLLSRQGATVLSQVSGYIRKIHVRPGQRVEVGAPLVDVDAREETAALDLARAGRESINARLDLARQIRSRTEALHKEGLATAQEVERTRADVAAAEAEDRAASAQVSQRQVLLQYHLVRAPVPGTVGDVLVRVGDFVTLATQLTSIVGSGALELSVRVPATRARQIQPGAVVEIIGPDDKVALSSKVFFVAAEADPKTQLVELKSAIENGANLRPSELVRVRVVYSTGQALQIPALAVVRQSGQAFAFVATEKDGNLIATRKVLRLGPLGENSYVVEQGLLPGDRVVTSSLQMLREGAPIKVAEGR